MADSSTSDMGVVVAGASGGIGQVISAPTEQFRGNRLMILYQPLSLLLKTCPLISELALYDVVNTPGVAADLSHISSPAVCSLIFINSARELTLTENQRLPAKG